MSQKALPFGFFPRLETINQDKLRSWEEERIERFKKLIQTEIELARDKGVSEKVIINELATKTAELYHLAYVLDLSWVELGAERVSA